MSIGVLDLTRGSILKIATQFARAQREASAFLSTLRTVNEELRRPSSWGGTAANDFREARYQAEGYARAARSARASAPGGSVASSAYPLAIYAAARGMGGGPMPPRWTPPLLTGPAGASPALAGFGGMWPGGAGFGGRGWRPPTTGGGGFGFGPLGAVFGGMMIEHAGKAELGMLGGPIDEAAKYQSAVAKFTLFGLGDTLNADAVKFAKSMNIIGTSMTDAMTFMIEAQGVFRESGLKGPEALYGAKLAAPMLAKIAFATASLPEDQRERFTSQSLAMLRFVELRGGLQSPERFNAIANAGWKAILSSGGNVNWEQLRQFMARGGVAAQGLSDEALLGKLEPVIGEMKGSTAGTALMTAYNRLVGGVRVPNQVAHLFADNGLWDQSKIVWNSQGGIKTFKGNPLTPEKMALFSTDPEEFYEKQVLPIWDKLGLKTLQDRARYNTIAFGRTGGALFTLLDRQQAVSHRSVEAQKSALGIDQSVDVTKATFAGQMVNYQKQKETLETQLGLVILPMLIRGLRWLNPLLQSAAAWVGEHSTLTKGLLALFAGLGVLTVTSGALLVISGAFRLISGAVAAGGGLASGLMGVAGSLAKVGAVVGAWEVGQKVGAFIYDHAIAGTSFDEWLGHKLTQGMALLGSQDARDALDTEDRYFHKSKGTPVVAHVNMMLDQQKLGTAVLRFQMGGLSSPETGISGFDGLQHLAPAGAGAL